MAVAASAVAGMVAYAVSPSTFEPVIGIAANPIRQALGTFSGPRPAAMTASPMALAMPPTNFNPGGAVASLNRQTVGVNRLQPSLRPKVA